MSHGKAGPRLKHRSPKLQPTSQKKETGERQSPAPPTSPSTFMSPPPRLLPTPIFGLVEQTLCKVLPGLVSVVSIRLPRAVTWRPKTL